jgi:photosystem II stability/assembly factor-like uncharacterized protein
VGAGVLVASQSSSAKDKLLWNQVPLPVKETLFDISFDPSKPDHGWLVGAKGTFLETFDGGLNWITRSFTSLDEDEEINYRFEVASLLDNEGWIIGKPSIMLHTRDGGKQFERIPLSPKLPGDPCSIKATGAGKAEMITTQGAVYTTVNGGLNWKAQVKETIDATLNRVSSSGTSGASFFTGKIANQVRQTVTHKNVYVCFSFPLSTRGWWPSDKRRGGQLHRHRVPWQSFPHVEPRPGVLDPAQPGVVSKDPEHGLRG